MSGTINTIKSICMRELQALERKPTVVLLESHIKLLVFMLMLIGV